MADITKVYVTEEFAETNFADGTLQLGIFTPVLTVMPLPNSASDELPNSLTFFAQYTLPGLLESSFSGNNLDGFPPPPIASPGIYIDGGLKIENVTLNAAGAFRMPGYDDEFGTVSPAQIAHGIFGDYRLDQFGDGEFAYVAYCRSDKRQFGYVQYAYVSPVEWRLIGYAYGAVDEPLMVVNLVPSPGAISAISGLLLARRSTRTREE